MGMQEIFDEKKFRAFVTKWAVSVGSPLCVKVVVFSAQDFEFAVHIQGIMDDMNIRVPYFPVIYYLSLGNSYPPVLNEDLDLVDNPLLEHEAKGQLAESLLADYRTLSEELLLDTRLKDFRFLPQLHVLVYGNETER